MKPEKTDHIINYIHTDLRWKNTTYTHEIKSYYSDIKDILTTTTNSTNCALREEYIQRLALMQTKAAFKLPGDPLNPIIE